ncbi:hypothetical protein JTM24_33900, partial [Pseudomonas aeruginosa]|nr:hypothetical protein [Pseudomonas aeruginosa]
QKEISLIYYPNREGLEDRVYRIKTERSGASTPEPRTTHIISNVELMGEAQRLIRTIVGNLLQLAHQVGNAGAQRTRNIVPQDQQLHHRFATDRLAVEAVVGFAGADRIEQGIQPVVFPHRIRV